MVLLIKPRYCKMKKLFAGMLLTLVLSTSGCCSLFASDKDLLLEIRDDLAESVRPTFVEALDKAVGPDGEPLYIDAKRTEKANLVDQMIESVDRVYPPTDEEGEPAPYKPAPLPWAGE